MLLVDTCPMYPQHAQSCQRLDESPRRFLQIRRVQQYHTQFSDKVQEIKKRQRDEEAENVAAWKEKFGSNVSYL
jgi:hypothetical protein